jgi:hypothetical protein
MRVYSRRTSVSVAVAAGLAAVGLSAGLAVAGETGVQSGFDTNASGQTIGSVRADSPVPDLIQINLSESDVVLQTETESDIGYIYSSDWGVSPGAEAKTPQEAAEMMKDRIDASGDIWISVYLEDGKTVIGKLKIGHVESGEDVG